MKQEELKRLDEGRELLGKIVDVEKFLEVILNPEYEPMLPRLYYGGLVREFPLRDDGFNRAYKEFLKTWIEDYLKVLRNKFEAL